MALLGCRADPLDVFAVVDPLQGPDDIVFGWQRRLHDPPSNGRRRRSRAHRGSPEPARPTPDGPDRGRGRGPADSNARKLVSAPPSSSRPRLHAVVKTAPSYYPVGDEEPHRPYRCLVDPHDRPPGVLSVERRFRGGDGRVGAGQPMAHRPGRGAGPSVLLGARDPLDAHPSAGGQGPPLQRLSGHGGRLRRHHPAPRADGRHHPPGHPCQEGSLPGLGRARFDPHRAGLRSLDRGALLPGLLDLAAVHDRSGRRRRGQPPAASTLRLRRRDRHWRSEPSSSSGCFATRTDSSRSSANRSSASPLRGRNPSPTFSTTSSTGFGCSSAPATSSSP